MVPSCTEYDDEKSLSKPILNPSIDYCSPLSSKLLVKKTFTNVCFVRPFGILFSYLTKYEHCSQGLTSHILKSLLALCLSVL